LDNGQLIFGRLDGTDPKKPIFIPDDPSQVPQLPVRGTMQSTEGDKPSEQTGQLVRSPTNPNVLEFKPDDKNKYGEDQDIPTYCSFKIWLHTVCSYPALFC